MVCGGPQGAAAPAGLDDLRVTDLGRQLVRHDDDDPVRAEQVVLGSEQAAQQMIGVVGREVLGRLVERTTGARCRSARASSRRLRSPPLTASAPPDSVVSRPSGRRASQPSRPTVRNASPISSSVTSPRATRRFSRTDVENMCASSAK